MNISYILIIETDRNTIVWVLLPHLYDTFELTSGDVSLWNAPHRRLLEGQRENFVVNVRLAKLSYFGIIISMLPVNKIASAFKGLALNYM